MENVCKCPHHAWGKVVKWLLVIGGLNWGLVGIGMLMNADWNVVHMILGSIAWLEAIVYILVGVAAVMKLFMCCKCCGMEKGAGDMNMGGQQKM